MIHTDDSDKNTNALGKLRAGKYPLAIYFRKKTFGVQAEAQWPSWPLRAEKKHRVSKLDASHFRFRPKAR